MRDPITDAAQDPSCLLCLTPDRGGSWWSRLRPPTPRNFAADSMTFTDSYTAQDGIGTDDFTLSVDFTLLEESVHGTINIGCMRCLYYDSTKGHQPCVRILKSDGTKSALYPVGTSHIWGNVASIKVIKTGQSVHMVVCARDGSTIKEGTVAIPDGATVTSSSGATTYPGNIFAASIRNDTTGTAVWQAAYSDLYDTSNPWPSPVPRNFAEEPATWYDLGLASSTIGMDDWEIGGELYANSLTAGKSIIYRSSNPRFGLYVTSSSQIIFVNYSATGSNERIYYYDNPPTGEWLSFKMQRAGGWLRWLINDIDVNSVEKTGLYVEMNNTSPFFVNEDCNLRNCYFKNLTTGRTVWSYPSEAERVRLITKTNVRTDHGSFETADVSVISRVATQLDLRGAYAEKTFIADCWFPATSNNGALNYFPVITQGDGLSGSGSSLVVNFSVQADYRASVASKRLQLTWADASGSIHTTNVVVTDAFFGKRHQIVGVIRPGASSTQYANELYIDGELVGRGSGSVSSFVFGNATAASIAQGSLHVIGRDYTGFLSQSSLLYRALIFDRALSPAEIAALTPKKQPLSWAGIRDVVRRGRAQRYFAVGDVLTVTTPRWNIEYEVVGFDQVEPADAALTHSLTLLPVRLVTAVQFDAPEPGNPDANRAQYGCNRWDWSAIRQWLNSAAAPGEWWTAQHEYDAAPAYAATLAGFMADLPADFLSAVAPARLVTALPNADGGGSVETVDRFWLPSRTEIFGDANNGVAEGVLMTKYVDATDADRIKYNAAGNSASWYLRSANTKQPHYVAFVEKTGIFSTSFLVSRDALPACIIA